MKMHRSFMCAFVLGAFQLLVKGQHHYSEAIEDEEDEVASLQSAVQMSLDYNSLISRMWYRGRPMRENDLFSPYLDQDGNQVLHGGGRLAVPDNCALRLQTVPLEVEEASPGYVHFPRCTQVERCGGCCQTPNWECRAEDSEGLALNVIKARLPGHGTDHLTFTGVVQVLVERHLSCGVRCKLNSSSCNSRQRLNRDTCACVCRERLNCSPPHVWDWESCQCQCPVVTECCEGSLEETCNLVFYNRTCECDIAGRALISSGQQMVMDPVDFSSPPLGRVTSHDRPDPCAGVDCPDYFSTIVNDGHCSCRPMRFFLTRRRHMRRARQGQS